MKKFLDLKQGIVKSKNQPSLMQIYLQSIRSSCYKIKAPQIDNIKQFVNQKQYNRDQGNTIKIKNTQKYYLDSQLTPMQKVNNKEIQIEKQIDIKFQQIFKQLEKGGFNSETKVQRNEKIILNTIIQKLDVLQQNKGLVPSIQLIKKIIYNMPCYYHLQTLNTLHSHVNSPNTNYKNIHQSLKEEQQFMQIQKSQLSQSQNTYKKHNYNYDSIIDNDQDFQAITQYETQNKINKSFSQIPQRHQIKYKVYSVNQLQQQQSQQQYVQQRQNQSQQENINNTMQSQDLKKWDQLQKITQRQQQQQQNSSIRQQSMQFKKILYMLESTQKKQKSRESQQKYKDYTRVKTVQSQSSRKSENKESVIVSCRMNKTSKIRQSNFKQDKSKTIKDIVKLLNNKYHRKVNFVR